MKLTARIVCFLICIIMVIAVIGCGKKTGEGEETDSSEKFRVPDSLLTPIAGFNLTRDDYHPVKGGVMANAQIEMHYPAEEIARLIAVKTFGVAYKGYENVLAEIGKPADGRLVLIGAKDLDEYRLLTRKEWWYYGYIAGDTIYYEPFDILLKRGISNVAIVQKIAQAALIKRSGGRMPLWMREAVASHVAGEGDIVKLYGKGLAMQMVDVKPSPEVIETRLAEATDRDMTRAAYYASYVMLEKLLAFATLDSILTFADVLREGGSLDEASRASFGMSYGAMIDKVRVDKETPEQ